MHVLISMPTPGQPSAYGGEPGDEASIYVPASLYFPPPTFPNRKDAYNGAEYIQEGLQIEQASVLYNIAALHAQLGSHGKRDTEQVRGGSL